MKKKNENPIIPEMSTEVNAADFQSFAVDYLSVIRYTNEKWAEIFPEDAEEWAYIANPDSVLDFIDVQQHLMEQNIGFANESIPLKIVALDDEYDEWLGDEEDTPSKRLAYCDGVTVDDALRLAQKHNMHYSYTLCMFPLIILPDDLESTKKRLNRQTQEAFQKYLKSLTQNLDVYVAPFMVDFRTIEDVEDDIIALAKQEMSGRKAATPERFKTIDIGSEPFMLCGIPIVFRETHDTMAFVPEQLYTEDSIRTRALNHIIMSEEFLEEFNITDIKPFLDSNLPKMIHDDFELCDDNTSFFDFFIAIWDVPEFVVEITEALKAEAEAQAKKERKKKKRGGLFGLNRRIDDVEEDDFGDEGGIQ